jgi:short-subunit dehydrogenase
MASRRGLCTQLVDFLHTVAAYLVAPISAAGLLNHLTAASYAVTKAAALSRFEWLAIAHQDQGIRVSVVFPQGVRTRRLRARGACAPVQSAEPARPSAPLASCAR